MSDADRLLSIVIPVLNERAEIEAAIASLRESIGRANVECEIIVIDGGSNDGTAEWLCTQSDVKTIQSERGRARQMNLGAENARGEWLLFLHADSRVEETLIEGLTREIARASTEPSAQETVLTFQLKFRGERPAYRRMEAGVQWRAVRLGLPYGDQGYAMPAAFFRAMGGFSEDASMEDLDFVLRLRSTGILRLLPFSVSTSTRQYERQGLFWAVAYNVGRLLVGVTLFYLRGPYPRQPEQKGERASS